MPEAFFSVKHKMCGKCTRSDTRCRESAHKEITTINLLIPAVTELASGFLGNREEKAAIKQKLDAAKIEGQVTISPLVSMVFTCKVEVVINDGPLTHWGWPRAY